MFKNKKYLIISGVILLLIVGTSFAYFFVQNPDDVNVLFNSKCLKVNFISESDVIDYIDSKPLSDADGILSEPYRFSVENTCDNAITYDVVLSLESDNTLDSSLIKIAIDDSTPSLVYDLNRSDDLYVAHTDSLNIGEKKFHDFRMWISDEATVLNSLEETISIKTGVLLKP